MNFSRRQFLQTSALGAGAFAYRFVHLGDKFDPVRRQFADDDAVVVRVIAPRERDCGDRKPASNAGWTCPVCGRGVNPNSDNCPCQK